MMDWQKPERFQGGGGSYQMSQEGGYCITFEKTSYGDFSLCASRHKIDFARMYVPAAAGPEDLRKAAAAMRELCDRFSELEVVS